MLKDLSEQELRPELRIGFPNDPPKELNRWTKEAMWYETNGVGKDKLVYCKLCPHECILSEGDRGFCRARAVKDSKLYTLTYGNPCAVHEDPIEKKPLFHFLPSSPIVSIATAGCNMRCLNCQNWEISQSRPEDTRNYDLPPQSLVAFTKGLRAPSIAYTYSEPIIFYEYTYESSLQAHAAGIRNVLVSAGYIEPQPLRKLCTVTDAANVDLKVFNDRTYRYLVGGKLAPVLKCLEIMKEEGVWLEITRLLVPTYSDDLTDIKEMSKWIVSALGPDTPLHLSRFHPAHKLLRLPPTPLKTLLDAEKIAKDSGINFVYVGNVPGAGKEDTLCPKCKQTVIRREGFVVLSNMLRDGKCPCGSLIAGVWA